MPESRVKTNMITPRERELMEENERLKRLLKAYGRQWKALRKALAEVNALDGYYLLVGTAIPLDEV